jgi:hypothetical protein
VLKRHALLAIVTWKIGHEHFEIDVAAERKKDVVLLAPLRLSARNEKNFTTFAEPTISSAPSSSAAPVPHLNDSQSHNPFSKTARKSAGYEESMSHTIPQLQSIFSRTTIGRKTVGITLRGRERRTIHRRIGITLSKPLARSHDISNLGSYLLM